MVLYFQKEPFEKNATFLNELIYNKDLLNMPIQKRFPVTEILSSRQDICLKTFLLGNFAAPE